MALSPLRLPQVINLRAEIASAADKARSLASIGFLALTREKQQVRGEFIGGTFEQNRSRSALFNLARPLHWTLDLRLSSKHTGER